MAAKAKILIRVQSLTEDLGNINWTGSRLRPKGLFERPKFYLEEDDIAECEEDEMDRLMNVYEIEEDRRQSVESVEVMMSDPLMEVQEEPGEDDIEAKEDAKNFDHFRKVSVLRRGSGSHVGNARTNILRKKNSLQVPENLLRDKDRRHSEDIVNKKAEKSKKRSSLPHASSFASFLDFLIGNVAGGGDSSSGKKDRGKRHSWEGQLSESDNSNAGTPIAGTPYAGTPVAGTPSPGTPQEEHQGILRRGRKKRPKEGRYTPSPKMKAKNRSRKVHSISVDDTSMMVDEHGFLKPPGFKLGLGLDDSSSDDNLDDVVSGHEHPYSIKMSHVRDGLRDRGSGEDITMPMDVDLNDNSLNVQFILQNKKVARKSSFEDNLKRPKKTKRSPIISFFRRSQSKLDGGSPGPTGRLFGHPLVEVCGEDGLAKPLMDLLQYLFQTGPYLQGVFRKPGNHKRVQDMRGRMDQGEEIQWEEQHTLVACSILKEFLRSLPDCLLQCDLYDQWVDCLNITDLNSKLLQIQRLLTKLHNAHSLLLRHLMCVLYHIICKSDENNMNPQALATCISPSMLWQEMAASTGNALADTVRQSEETEKARRLVQFMLEHVVETFGQECTRLFGEAPSSGSSKTRQDSSTDSDSMHSMLGAADNTGRGRHDNSSIDSMERDSCFTETDSSPQLLMKAHLSPTNLSRDSGLTNSDPRLYDDIPEELVASMHHAKDHKPSMLRSVSEQDQGKPGPVVDSSQLSRSYDCTLDTAHMEGAQPVPPPRNKKSRRGSPGEHEEEMVQAPPRSSTAPHSLMPQNLPALRHSSSAQSVSDFRRQIRNAKSAKRVSDDSLGGYLGSVDEDTVPHMQGESSPDTHRLQELQQTKSRDIGILRKSSSGTRIYVRDDTVAMAESEAVVAARQRAKLNRRSAPPEVQEVQTMLEQAKANVYVRKSRHDQSPARHHPSAYPPSSSAKHPGLQSQQPTQGAHHYSSPAMDHASTRTPAQTPVTFRMSPHDSPDESEESMMSSFTYMVPVTSKSNDNTNTVATATPSRDSAYPVNTAAPSSAPSQSRNPAMKRLLVKSNSLDAPYHPSPDMVHTAPTQSTAQPKTSHDVTQGVQMRHPRPTLSPSQSKDFHSPRGRILQRSNAVDGTPVHVEKEGLHKKGMTSKGADMFPSRVVKNLYRKSLDESAIMKSLAAGDNEMRVSASPRDHSGSRQYSSQSLEHRPKPSSGTPSIAQSPAVQRLRQGTAMERSASDGSLHEQFLPDGSPQQGGQWKRPKNPPSYQEAIQRKACLQSNLSAVSQQEIERQRNKSARAKQLYEESLKKLQENSRSDETHTAEQPVLRQRSNSTEDYRRQVPQSSRDMTPTRDNVKRTSHSTPPDMRHPPCYEHACQRAEQIREQKRERTPPKYTRREGEPSSTPPRQTGHQNTPSPARESNSGITKKGSDHLKDRLGGGGSAPSSREATPTRSDSSREGSVNRKHRRRSKDRRIGHRNSDSKLSSAKSSRQNGPNLNRSKSDSSEHINKISKFKDVTMSENKENVSNENLQFQQQTIEKLEKLKLSLDKAPSLERKQSLDRLEKVAKDLENEKMRRQKFTKSAENISYKVLADNLASQDTEKPHSTERRVSLTRSVKNRNWHKDLAEQYKDAFVQPNEDIPKYSYGTENIPDKAPPSQESERPQRRWAPPVHPSKDLIITYSRDASKSNGMVRRAQSHVSELQHRRPTQEEKAKQYETRGRSNSDAPLPSSQYNQMADTQMQQSQSLQPNDNRLNSNDPRCPPADQQQSENSESSSTEDLPQNISWSVSQLRALYGESKKSHHDTRKDTSSGGQPRPAQIYANVPEPQGSRQQAQHLPHQRNPVPVHPGTSGQSARDYHSHPNSYGVQYSRQSTHGQRVLERTNPNAEEAYV